MTRNEKILLLLLASINFTHILDFMIIMPLGNYLMPDFHITTQQFSLIVASYSYAAFASGILAAFVIDNFDRKKTLLFGYTGFVVGTLLCALAPNYQLLIGARIMAGLFGGLIGAQVLSIVADSFPYEKRGRAMGYLMAAFSFASVIGVPVSLYMASVLSWHAPFYMVAAIGFLLLPFTYRYIPPMKGHLEQTAGRKPLEAFGVVFSRKSTLIALTFSSFLWFGHFLLVPFLNPYMEFNVGFTDMQIPLIYAVGGAATLISAPIFGRLADKYGKLKIYMITALGTLPFVWMISNMPPIAFYYVLIVTGLWFIISNGRSIAAGSMVSNVVEPQYRGSFMSINSSLQQLFVGSASFVAGLIVTNDPVTKKLQNYHWAGYLSIAILLFSVYLGYWLKKNADNL
jgi:MFS transporter, DHA1 family, inner membrane transport protein